MSIARRAAILVCGAGAGLTIGCGAFGDSGTGSDVADAGPPGDGGPGGGADAADAADGAGADGAAADGGATFQMFVAAGPINGNFGGVDKADLRCQTSADAAGLEGHFVALLVGKERPDPFLMLRDGRYVNTNGQLLFSSAPSPVSKYQNKMLDEKGAVVAGIVWTGGDGTDCDSWKVLTATGGTGRCHLPEAWFNGGSSQGCSVPAAVYCVETK